MQDNYRCPSTYALLFMLAVLNIAIFQVTKSLGNTDTRHVHSKQ